MNTAGKAPSLRTRVAVTVFIVVGLTVIGIVMSVIYEINKNTSRWLQAQLTHTLEQYSRDIPPSGPTLDQVTQMIISAHHHDRIGVYIPQYGWISNDHTLFAVNISPPHVESTLDTYTTVSRHMVGMRIFPNGVILAVSDSDHRIDVLSKRFEVSIILGGFGGAIICGIVASLVVRMGLRPMKRLVEATRRVAETEDFVPLSVRGDEEIVTLTQEFNTMMEALQLSREKQHQLIADASHELRTPLTSLRTNIELLIAVSTSGNLHAIPPEDLQGIHSDVIAQLEEMTTLIGELIDMARDKELHQEQLECSAIINAAIERVQRRRSDIHFLVTTDEWYVFADREAFSRAIVNLLDNAAKWSPTDGQVEVTLTVHTDAEALLQVRDYGPGIPDNEKTKVFERFYRSDSSRSMPGSGLGLAIVKQEIERITGSIHMCDAPEGGLEVRVLLPGTRSSDCED